MGEPTEGAGDTGAGTTANEDDKSVNAQAKELKWVKEGFAELAALRQEKTDRETADAAQKDADEKAKREAAIEKAKEEKQFEEAARLQKEASDKEIADLKTAASKSELRAELSAEGFAGRFTDFLASSYDAETHGTIAEYAKAAAADEGNRQFLATGPAPKPAPPGKPSVSGASATLTKAQLDDLMSSGDSEKRLQAIAYKKALYDKDGNFDGLK
ncbi:MAG: hypothetical protein GY835_19645 [bacterium]|nr:hypothetical protein [bacterium]